MGRGHHLTIVSFNRMISDVSCPSQELRALQRLNAKDLRLDPYDHTIPVLDFLAFDNLVFVVMPR